MSTATPVVIDCHLSQAEQAITVGTLISATCEGPWPQLKQDQLRLEIPEDDKYKFVLQKLDFQSATTAQLVVTSYLPGQHDLQNIKLVDGENQVQLRGLKYTVQSVIDPQNPVKEPFGPFGPGTLHIPVWYWGVLGGFILLIALLVAWRVWRRLVWRRLVQKMKSLDSALSPLHQLSKEIRRMRRHFGYFSGLPTTPEEISKTTNELDQAFRVYLVRRFHVPAQDWTDRKVLRHLSKTHEAMMEVFGRDLARVLLEIKRAVHAEKTVSAQDTAQLIDLCQKLADRFEAQGAKKGQAR
jgi:hypothetical protein